MLTVAKLLTISLLASGFAWARGQADLTVAQSSDTSGAASADQTGAPAPPPSPGGIDEGGLASEQVGKWFFKPQVYGEETVGTDIENENGSLPVGSITRAYAALLLDRKWRHYGFGLGYLGGGSVFSANPAESQTAQEGILQQEINWNSGQLQLFDVFSYLPEGGFGGIPFGGLGLFQLGLGNYLGLLSSSRFGLLSPSQFASFGNTPRISNTAVIEAEQNVTSRSSITGIAGYGTLHFFNNGPFDSQQGTVLLSYNYLLSHRSAIAVVAGYQNFGIAGVSSALRTQFATLIYQRRLSRSLSVLGGAGPIVSNYSKLFSTPGRQWSWTGLATVSYQRQRTSLSANYLSYENAGSGYLLGARTNRATVGVERQFSRNWSGELSLGYARSSALEEETFLFFNLPARRNFDSIYLDLRLSRQLSAHLTAFAVYNIGREQFDAATPCSTPTCGLTTNRQTVGIGLVWNPTATRIR